MGLLFSESLRTGSVYNSNSSHNLQRHQVPNSHTHNIFLCEDHREVFQVSYIVLTCIFGNETRKKKVPTVSFITKWRASSGFTQLYNEMILCLITEEERMKCTYVLLHKMLYGWSDMWKQQNLLSSARISRCSYVFEVFSQYFAQWWMFNY